MRHYRFRIWLDKAQCLAFYKGQLKDVIVQTDQGLRVQLPMLHFRPYMQHEGLSGYFLLTLNDDGKFIQLEKLN